MGPDALMLKLNGKKSKRGMGSLCLRLESKRTGNITPLMLIPTKVLVPLPMGAGAGLPSRWAILQRRLDVLQFNSVLTPPGDGGRSHR